MVITVIPIFLIYPFMQKYFAKCCMDLSFGVPGPHSISLSAYAAASSRVLFFLLAPDSRQYSRFSCIQLSISSYMIFDLLLIPSISEPRQEGRTSPWNFAPLKHALFHCFFIWAIYLYKGRELLHPRRGFFLRKWGENEKKRSQILKNSESDFAFCFFFGWIRG